MLEISFNFCGLINRGLAGRRCALYIRSKLYQAVKIAAFVLSFGEFFGGLLLHTQLALSDIEKLRELAVDVGHDVLPLLGVEGWVEPWYVSDDDPCIELTNIRRHGIGINRIHRRLLKTNRTHVVVEAVVDVSPVRRLESVLQVVERRVLVNVVSYRIAMLLVDNRSITLNSKFSVEETEPLNQCVVTREVTKRNAVVRRLEAKKLKRLLGRDRLLVANSQCRV